MSDHYIPPDLAPKCSWKVKDQTEHDPHKHDTREPKPKILSNVLQHIGNTPMVRLNKIPHEYGIKCEILVKCEYFNAGGSVKDRIGLKMIEDAESDGRLKPGDTIIEPTSGNTGIGLALASAVKGYRCIIVMPEKMSAEKANVLHALGAEIIRTPTSARYDAPNSHIRVAQKLCSQIKNSIILDQYRNPSNPLAHYDNTAVEILEQCDNRIDMIVVGAGTGGTITGIGRKFKESLPNCKVIGVDPIGSILALPESLNKSDTTFYEVEGVGYDFIPSVLDRSVVDQWYKSEDRSSLIMARKLISNEGLLCGASSGSAVVAAIEAAKDLKEGQRCVVILPDGVRNYMTKFIDDHWMEERNFVEPLNKEQVNKPWFWNETIGNLVNNTVVKTLDSRNTCSEAIKIMKSFGYDQIPVLDNDKKFIKGMVTVSNIMAKIAGGSIQLDTTVDEVIVKNFPRIESNATIVNLLQLLKSNHYVAVIEKVANSENERIKGIITHIDVVNYIVELEEFEQ